MIVQDILKDLYFGALSSQQADAIFDELMDSSNSSQAREILGLSPMEWTAFGQGAGFPQLAKWRYEGWPSSCQICGAKIQVDQYGWLLADEGMRHLICPR